jgi:type VI secretion system secreted protein Hcp
MAAGDIILDLDGVEGESKDSVYSGKIELENFSFGVSNSTSTHSGGGGGTSRAAFSDVSFNKYVDKSTTNVFVNTCIGKHFKTAIFYMRKTGGDDTPKMYLKVTLTEPILSSYQLSYGGGGGLAMESLSMSYSKIQFEYFIQDEKGVTKSAGDQTFDVKANKKG